MLGQTTTGNQTQITVLQTINLRSFNALKLSLKMDMTSSLMRNMWLGCSSTILIQFHKIYARIHSISLHNDLFDESPLKMRNDQGGTFLTALLVRLLLTWIQCTYDNCAAHEVTWLNYFEEDAW